jgi:hypothetical protein
MVCLGKGAAAAAAADDDDDDDNNNNNNKSGKIGEFQMFRNNTNRSRLNSGHAANVQLQMLSFSVQLSEP